MFKQVYEFTKVFAILFLLTGVFFLSKGGYVLAAVGLISFGIVKFIDSDWAFDNFNFKNHNLIVIFVTFILIILNFSLIYHEFHYSSLFSQATKEDKEAYLNYENSLYDAFQPCADMHNMLIDKFSNRIIISESEIEKANSVCYGVINDINEAPVSDKFPKSVQSLCNYMKSEFNKISMDVASYKYDANNPQESVVGRVKDNSQAVVKNMQKAREILRMPTVLEDERKNFIKF